MVAADPRIEHLAAGPRRCYPENGRVDIHATAAALHLRVRSADLGPKLLAAVFGDVVVLNSSADLTAGRRRFAFGHEVAHVLIQRGAMPWVDRGDVEWWADWFAHELVFPRRWLRDRANWIQLRLFDDPAEQRTIALQLAAMSGELPVMRFRGEVLCARCGEQPFFRNCDCRLYREGFAHSEELPVFEPDYAGGDGPKVPASGDFRDLLRRALRAA